ncbi:unknown protein [Seminavis robusta]|uniref:Uncharacterized protein n=1 Tax=Seminavis robusta TaxID=568900 RepID=A0A9N8DE81_9STRA|nr:unknown protein [Seminavis robusta]|eukprot:Sro107_g053940.1 n/a (262) ;mRNA; f:82188-82973
MKIASVQTLFLVVLAGTVNLCKGIAIDAGNEVRRDRILQEFLQPQELEDSCGELDYALFIAVDRGHLGMFAQPTREDLPEDDNVEEKCGPVFFHQMDPATKVVEQSSMDKFPHGALYPLGNHKMSDILEAFDSVPVSDAEYDIIKNHCAILVLQMMCSLKIPVIHQILDWVADELMRRDTHDIIMFHAHNSTNFDVLGMARNESTTTTIRTLVAYDADMFYCVATDDVKQQVECSSGAASKVFSFLLAFALLAVVTGFITV